jgi:hypothetical protein
MTGRIHDVERARDRAELLLEMSDIGARRDSRGRSRSAACREKENSKRTRCEMIYRDGGACTYWLSGSSDSDDSDKENLDPSSDPVASSSSRDIMASSTRPRSNSTMGANYLAFPSSSSPLGPVTPVNDAVYPLLSGPGVKPYADAD